MRSALRVSDLRREAVRWLIDQGDAAHARRRAQEARKEGADSKSSPPPVRALGSVGGQSPDGRKGRKFATFPSPVQALKNAAVEGARKSWRKISSSNTTERHRQEAPKGGRNHPPQSGEVSSIKGYQPQALEEAEKCHRRVTSADSYSAREVTSLLTELCQAHAHPHADKAAELAMAWISHEATAELEVWKERDMKTLSLIIGIAAGAAVLAIVILVRRGERVRVANRDLAPSDDLRALIELAEGGHQASALAAELRAKADEPWSWRLEDGLGALDDDASRRFLLSGFAAVRPSDVSAFSPERGERFDRKRMAADHVSMSEDDVWLVAEDTPDEMLGYARGARTLVKAGVEVCTADWLALSTQGCVAGEAIIARADELIAGGAARRALWRAPWGFTFPEDLRELPESALDEWRRGMMAALNPYYEGRPERQLRLVGGPGEPFDSAMESADASGPIGDAIVDEVVERDGIPQHGLACPGGSPLLLAIVRTAPVRTGT